MANWPFESYEAFQLAYSSRENLNGLAYEVAVETCDLFDFHDVDLLQEILFESFIDEVERN